MHAPMHFGLAFAVGVAGFDSTAANWGACILVIGSAMQATGVTLNWIAPESCGHAAVVSARDSG